ncbi:ABC transporter, ATP-binding protein [Enterococcus faecalis 13-SD-W-01]|nr:ABC transporter, ATP-binding protein [Enterococcus faecalis 13-SD-W-01]
MKILKISELVKNIEAGFCLDIKYLEFENGKIYGLTGSNGAGKTTFLKCLCGLLIPDGGNIDFADPKLNDPEKILKNIGANFTNIDSLENFTLNELYKDHVFYYGVKNAVSLQELLSSVGLNLNKEIRFGKLSLGMKQRFLFGLSMLHEPSLVLLDEPFNGLDPDGKMLFIEFIKKNSMNRVMIISGHDLADLETVIDEVIFIKDGKVKDICTIQEIQHNFTKGLKGYYEKQKRSKHQTASFDLRL